MSEQQPRNDKGRWQDTGKESEVVRLDKDIADLGREEIQKLVRQRTEENELLKDTLSVIVRYLNEQDEGFEEFITEDPVVEGQPRDEEIVDKFYNTFV